MALQCPTADVRCMSFGSPKVGNAAFCEAFRWVTAVALLVGACMSKLAWGCRAWMWRPVVLLPSRQHQQAAVSHLLGGMLVRTVLLLLCACIR